jgi:hypothetical protein
MQESCNHGIPGAIEMDRIPAKIQQDYDAVWYEKTSTLGRAFDSSRYCPHVNTSSTTNWTVHVP